MLEKKYRKGNNSEIKQELEALKSDLSDIRYERTYKVPEGFWKSQESEILRKTISDQPNKIHSNGIIKFRPWIIGIAASIIILSMFIIHQRQVISEDEVEFLNDVELSVLEDYIIEEAGLLYDVGELDEALIAIE